MTTSPVHPRNHPPRLPAWARVLIPVVVFMPLAASPLLALQLPAVRHAADQPTLWGAVTLVAAFGIALTAYLVVSILLVRWVDRRPAAALGLKVTVHGLTGMGVGVLVALLVGVGGTVVADVLGLGRDAAQAADSFLEYPDLALLVLLLGQAFVLQGIGEEVLFRGYLLQTLNKSPRAAVFIAAAAFAVPHLSSQGGQESAVEHLIYLWIPFGFSVSAAALAIRFRSVWAAVGVHGGFHVSTYLCFALGLTLEGPGLWLVLGTPHLVVGVILMAQTPSGRWREIATCGTYTPSAISEPRSRH
ncbi:CPBP family intramembrane glutamic endopeptidase [Kocuria sp. ZOR0020]|uniref:CPBP family intramembrane glutamic endopeptidase n=1 Tax=Kocuria sp. ZOR0020 TaxID=1339234 RepID=UPI000648ACE7|nr:CPBP family intramembrane glutamic endopeptidase [Kocuria sp. ZOR0020]